MLFLFIWARGDLVRIVLILINRARGDVAQRFWAQIHATLSRVAGGMERRTEHGKTCCTSHWDSSLVQHDGRFFFSRPVITHELTSAQPCQEACAGKRRRRRDQPRDCKIETCARSSCFLNCNVTLAIRLTRCLVQPVHYPEGH